MFSYKKFSKQNIIWFKQIQALFFFNLLRKIPSKQAVSDKQNFFQECVPYTELVIATGSGGPFPGKCDSLECSSSKLAQLYKDFTCEVQKAEEIVIVGGGAVGVEMSGEIRDSFPDKKVFELKLNIVYCLRF